MFRRQSIIKMNTLKTLVQDYKYQIALISVLNFLLTPIHIQASGWHSGLIVVINYSLIIVTSSLLATNRKSILITYTLGITCLLLIWCEFSFPNGNTIEWWRLIFSFVLFANFCILLVRQLMYIKTMTLHFILGPLLGFLYLGILGGISFEMTHLLDPASFNLPLHSSDYTFYYFSFISITTVGYGDITPIVPSSQALTMVLNIIGQFYLAIVIAVFVGKYNNVKS